VTPRLVLLRLGEKQLALPLEKVWHILLTPRLFPLALIRPGFKGVFLHQDEVLPLLDLPGLLAVPGSGKECPYVMVCETEFGPLGLPVDQILQIVERQLGALTEDEPEADRFSAEKNFVYNGNRYLLLDLGALLATLPR